MAIKTGYYWVNYPEIQWQIAHWNGTYWHITGSMVNIEKVKEVGEYLGSAGRAKPLNVIQANEVLPLVRSSTSITPISCEIDENSKKFIEMVEFTNKQFERYATDVLRIPKEMFGSK